MAESVTVKKGNKYFVIEARSSLGKNWVLIQREDGEGGWFPEEEFFDAIEKYYKKNF